MIIRSAKPDDVERMHELFLSVSVSRDELGEKRIPKRGFFEYDLSLEEMLRRVNGSGYTLVMERGSRILAYLIANDFGFMERQNIKDSIFDVLPKPEPGVVYADQMFLDGGLPAFLAGRFVDVWDYLLRGEKVTGVITAIPQKPWTNVSSTRFALHRGFKRQDIVSTEDIEFGIFTKPYLEKDNPFEFQNSISI